MARKKIKKIILRERKNLKEIFAPEAEAAIRRGFTGETEEEEQDSCPEGHVRYDVPFLKRSLRTGSSQCLKIGSAEERAAQEAGWEKKNVAKKPAGPSIKPGHPSYADPEKMAKAGYTSLGLSLIHI